MSPPTGPAVTGYPTSAARGVAAGPGQRAGLVVVGQPTGGAQPRHQLVGDLPRPAGMAPQLAPARPVPGALPVAAHVGRGYRERTGHGPSWGELRRYAGWPREVTNNLLPRLRAAGWLAYDDEPGSLRPGPAAAPRAAEVG